VARVSAETCCAISCLELSRPTPRIFAPLFRIRHRHWVMGHGGPGPVNRLAVLSVELGSTGTGSLSIARLRLVPGGDLLLKGKTPTRDSARGLFNPTACQ
jgi:hypothetical protein